MKPSPRWVRLLFRLLIPASRRDDVQGDLNEVHARRRARQGPLAAWFATSLEALRIAAAFFAERGRLRGKAMFRWFTWPEVKLGARLIVKQPILSLVAILALALGIGLSASGFSLLEAMLFSRLPYENGDRFVQLLAYSEPFGRRAALDLQRYRLLRQSADALEHLGAAAGGEMNLIGESGQVELIKGAWMTPRTFRHLPAVPLLGRGLIEEDGRPGAPAVALIRQSLWERRFNASESAVGGLLNISGVKRTIVGVLPDSFEFPNSAEIWLPLDELYLGGSEAGARSGVRMIGILPAGISLREAQTQVRSLSQRFEAAHPSAPEMRLKLRPFTQPPDEKAEAMGIVLVAVLVLILLVVAFNVANLIRARTLMRRAELAVRTALGATRKRLIGQLFFEAALISWIAALLGLAGAYALIEQMNGSIDELPFWVVFSITPRTIAFVLFLALTAATVGGVVPALQATRTDTAAVLQQEGRGFSRGFGRLGAAAVMLQMALSVALLSGALVMVRGLSNHLSQVAELPRGQVLTAQVQIDSSAAASNISSENESNRLAGRRQALLDALAGVPGLKAVGAANRLPQYTAPLARIRFEPQSEGVSPSPIQVPWAAVGPGFFQALGAAPLQGRLLDQSDSREGAPLAAVVNEPFARHYFPDRNPLGLRFRRLAADASEQAEWIEIVGVVPDLGLSVGDPEMAGGFYLPLSLASPDFFYLVMSTPGDPLQLAAPLRHAAARVDAAIQIRRIMTLEEVGEQVQEGLAGIASALTAMGGMALLLSAMGIYAIMSFTVTARTREIGIRLALGAVRRQILTTILGRSCALLACGALLGCLLGALVVRMRGMFVFRLPEAELWVFAAVLGVMALSGWIACWIPARRALKIAPTKALSQ